MKTQKNWICFASGLLQLCQSIIIKKKTEKMSLEFQKTTRVRYYDEPCPKKRTEENDIKIIFR